MCECMYTHITCLHVYLLHVFVHVLHCPYAHMHALCVSVYTCIGAWYRYCVCLCVHIRAIYLHVHMQTTCSWYVVEPQAEGRGQEEQGRPPASSPSLSHSWGNTGPFVACVHDPERPAHRPGSQCPWCCSCYQLGGQGARPPAPWRQLGLALFTEVTSRWPPGPAASLKPEGQRVTLP